MCNKTKITLKKKNSMDTTRQRILPVRLSWQSSKERVDNRYHKNVFSLSEKITLRWLQIPKMDNQ